MVNQVKRLGGRWSMKISQSASPRNRSSRSSRSPVMGSETAEAAIGAALVTALGTAVAAPLAAAWVPPASVDPAMRSATDVIRHRNKHRPNVAIGKSRAADAAGLILKARNLLA